MSDYFDADEIKSFKKDYNKEWKIYQITNKKGNKYLLKRKIRFLWFSFWINCCPSPSTAGSSFYFKYQEDAENYIVRKKMKIDENERKKKIKKTITLVHEE